MASTKALSHAVAELAETARASTAALLQLLRPPNDPALHPTTTPDTSSSAVPTTNPKPYVTALAMHAEIDAKASAALKVLRDAADGREADDNAPLAAGVHDAAAAATAALVDANRAQAQLAVHAAAHAVGCAEDEVNDAMHQAVAVKRAHELELEATARTLAGELAPTEALANAAAAVLRSSRGMEEDRAASLSRAQREASTARAEASQLASVTRSLKVSLAQSRGEVEAARAQGASLARSMQELQSQLAAVEGQRDHLKTRAEAAELERNVLAAEARTAREQLSAAHERAQSAISEKAGLRVELESAHINQRALARELSHIDRGLRYGLAQRARQLSSRAEPSEQPRATVAAPLARRSTSEAGAVSNLPLRARSVSTKVADDGAELQASLEVVGLVAASAMAAWRPPASDVELQRSLDELAGRLAPFVH